PVISAYTPAANATKVALTAPVTLTLSEAVTGVSASSISVTNSAGVKFAVTVSYDAATRKATVSHPAFAQLTKYTVSASAAIKDASGNTLTATAWSFTTADTTAPTVSGFSPAHNSTAVSAAVVLSPTFSEPVTGVSASSVSLINVDTGLAVPATVGYDATTRKVTITPTSLLAYSSNFRVSFNGAAIKDAAGNLLSVPTWSFTVQDDPNPPDENAPSAVTNFVATVASSYRVDLTWDVATDNIGVTGYQVYMDGGLLGKNSANGYSVTTLSPGTTYVFSILAYDAAGNLSTPVDMSATTPTEGPAS
ncbi:MAG: Ig-like domain-containing protein, partial [Gemmatimonadaceae bacterium]|nr:Ig-like domain-containing protein [Gemmatimonadaceae bacterium]